MEWQDDVDEEERGLDKAFTLIREAPAALPLKASKAAAAAGGSKPEVRHLRQRAPAGGPPAASAEQLANRQRPLVVIVEGTESVDCHCLRDFILTASEVRTCLSSALG